jgi:phage gp36-like protein
MAKPIEQIEQDLTKLRAASSQIGIELTAAYKSYFNTLEPILKKESIRGCYYLCTNAYTEDFLRLSYNQRCQLLKTLQRVIKNAVTNLVTKIEPSATSNNDDDDEPTGDLTTMSQMQTDWFATPESLSTWHKNLEGEISQSLKEISYKVNLLLQQGQVMPPAIPKPILEANPQADERGGNIANIPNILSILIEQDGHKNAEINTEDEDENEDKLPNIVQIRSLYLRLTEIEFSDGTVLTSRKNINQLANKVKNLRREYLQKQQEYKVAEAEAAWRNSWFED